MTSAILRSAVCGAAVLLSFAAVSAAAAQTVIGAWSVSVTAGEGRRSSTTAILMGSDGASLVAGCDVEGVNLFVSYIDPLPKQTGVTVAWRLDSGPVRRQVWEEGADRSTLSPGPPARDAAVLRQIAGARSLQISAAGRRTTFALDGARQVAALIGPCPVDPSPAASPPRPGG